MKRRSLLCACGRSILLVVEKVRYVRPTRRTESCTWRFRILQRYLEQLYINPNNLSTLNDVLAYTRKDPREEYPARNVDAFVKALSYSNETSEWDKYLKARTEDAYLGGTGTITGALDRYDLDALIMPTEVASNMAALAGNIRKGFNIKQAPY